MADDKAKIPDANRLLRRIHPNQLVANKRAPGRRRLSSVAFKDRELSVDVEEMLNSAGRDWTFTLGDRPGHALVRFTAGFARQQQEIVQHDPIPDNDAHALVIGEKTGDIKDAFKENCEWVSKPADVD